MQKENNLRHGSQSAHKMGKRGLGVKEQSGQLKYGRAEPWDWHLIKQASPMKKTDREQSTKQKRATGVTTKR